jgi:hypothetical protein
MQSTISELYKRIRANGATAQAAYIQAQNRFAAGVEWWNIPNMRANIEYNQAGKDGARWIEHAATGLRFVGYADEVATRNYNYAYGIDHTGWFTDDDGTGAKLRGVVYQLPARKGKPQYIAGYIDSENFDDTGGARLYLNTIYEGEKGGAAEGASYDKTAREVARHADSIAEKQAEEEREYNEAWRAGSDYAEELQGIKETRRACLELISAIKKERARGAAPVICNALREQVKAHLRIIGKAKKHAAELWDDYEHLRNPRNAWRAHLWAAFADGAGIDDNTQAA